MVLINCSNLCLTYSSSVVVEGFSFNFCEGDYVCIVGENGSGKSTLLKGILGLKLLKHGSVEFCGVNRNEIGFLPQKISLKSDFPASVFEVVLSGFCAKINFFNQYSSVKKAKAFEILKLLKIEDLKNSSFSELSRGQQQRVLLARALCATEKILFLDEPCSGFDPVVSANFYRIIRQFNRQKRVAIVMITHDLKQVFDSVKTVIHMDKKPIFVGSLESYVESAIGKSFLGGC